MVAAWSAVLGDAAWVLTRAEAVAAGWFGPVPEAHLGRIGDVVVVCHGTYAVVATRSEKPIESRLVAYHGVGHRGRDDHPAAGRPRLTRALADRPVGLSYPGG